MLANTRAQVRGIGDPLVWKHSWCEESKTVMHQYKFSLADEGSFECDEWGPWVQKEVTYNDHITGAIVTRKVLRSDPKGVALVKSYPQITDFPGMEEWIDLDTWKAEQVFDHLKKWKFHSNQATAQASWDSLRLWHMSHQNPNTDIDVGEPITISSTSLSTTPMPWSKMWEIIMEGVDVNAVEANVQQAQKSAKESGKANAKQGPSFLNPRSKRVDCEALSKSTNEVQLNRVTNPNYTEKQQKAAIARDEVNGASYLFQNINSRGPCSL